MGRAPCCDKSNVKKGPWSPEEDAKLKSFIEQNGTGGNWIALPQKMGLKRCGKSCRLRWLNYLRPNLKHGDFSEDEDRVICGLYVSIGSRWSVIAAQLPGRTDNDIKNYWNTRLKKKFMGKQRKEIQARRGRIQMQEMRKSSETSTIVFNNYSQTTYWPELPVISPMPMPYYSQEPRSNDIDSLRNLLFRLGGRFSDDEKKLLEGKTLQFPTETVPSNCLFEQSGDAFCKTGSEFNQTVFAIGETELPLLQAQIGNGGKQLQEDAVNDSSKGLFGLEFLLEEEISGFYGGEISSLFGCF